MEFDEQTYDKIERYLANELKGDELAAFEAERKSNKALAREVALSAEMKEFLADNPENELRKNLQQLNEQIKEDPNKAGHSFRYLYWLLPLLLVAGVLLLNIKSKTAPKAKPKTEETKGQQEEKNNHETKTDEAPDDKDNPKEKTQPDKKKGPKKQRIYAANFKPLPALEVLIENNIRNNNFTIEVLSRTRNSQISKLEESISFQFAARINTNDYLLDKTFNIHLYSNDKPKLENGESLFSNEPQLEETKAGSYALAVKKNIVLVPGLYYYMLEEAETEQVYFAGKFEVRMK